MAVKFILGMLPGRNYFLPAQGLNLRRYLSRSSYSTAQKVENISKEKILSTEECRIHNQSIPTLEQIQNDPKLRKKLFKMYKKLADDSDFQEITRYSMGMGLKHLRKKHLAKINIEQQS
jgi:hypothetical protein